MPALRPAVGQMALQPHQLGHLHLGRHRRRRHSRARGGRWRCIPRPRRGRGGRARRWCPSASSPVVETQSGAPSPSRTTSEQVASKLMPATSCGRDAGRAPARPGTAAPHTAPPDVLGVVLGVVGRRAVHDDRLLGAAEQPARRVEHAGARAAGADVDGADERLYGRVPRRCVAPLARPRHRSQSRMSSMSASGASARSTAVPRGVHGSRR